MSENPDQTLVVTKDSVAAINLGILVSIILTAIMGGWYLKGITLNVSLANATLDDVRDELKSQNDTLRKNSETLIAHGIVLQQLDDRVGELERP